MVETQPPRLSLAPVRRADGGELVQANRDSRDYHAPFAHPFITMEGFSEWFATLCTGAQAAFVAREAGSGRIVGVTRFSLRDSRAPIWAITAWWLPPGAA